MELKILPEMAGTVGKALAMELPFDLSELTVRERMQKMCELYNRSKGTLNEEDGYDCPICNNRGDTAELRYNGMFGIYNEVHIPCRCMETRRMIKRLAKSGLQDVFRKYTFARYEAEKDWQRHIKEMAVRFTGDDAAKWFFIGGQSGCGKTHICTAIALHYLKAGKRIRYMLWRDEVVKLKASVNNSEVYSAMMDELKQTEVLYIDDLFKTGRAGDGTPQRPTSADINIAFELINYRSMSPGRITLISSECNLEELLDIDEALGGRIIENSNKYGYCLNVKKDRGRNYRLRGAVSI